MLRPLLGVMCDTMHRLSDGDGACSGDLRGNVGGRTVVQALVPNQVFSLRIPIPDCGTQHNQFTVDVTAADERGGETERKVTADRLSANAYVPCETGDRTPCSQMQWRQARG